MENTKLVLMELKMNFPTLRGSQNKLSIILMSIIMLVLLNN